MSVIGPEYEIAQLYAGGEIPEPNLVVVVISDFGYLNSASKPVSEQKLIFQGTKIGVITLFAYSCKATVLIDGEVVATCEAKKYNDVATVGVAIDRDTGGKPVEITLRSEHIQKVGYRFASFATMGGY